MPLRRRNNVFALNDARAGLDLKFFRYFRCHRYFTLLAPWTGLIVSCFIVAPSAPLLPSFNENKTTFYLTWKPPSAPNGVVKEYAIKLRKDGVERTPIFTESIDTYYDTKINSSKILWFQVSIVFLCLLWLLTVRAQRVLTIRKHASFITGPRIFYLLFIVILRWSKGLRHVFA